MNCIDFRRQCLLEPMRDTPERIAHAETCERCAQHLAEVRSFDLLIASALAVKPPDGLAKEIILKTERRTDRRLPSAWRYGLAASLLLCLVGGLLLSSVKRDLKYDLAEQTLQHVIAEPEALAQHGDVSFSQVEQVAAKVGLAVSDSLARVSYVGTCNLGDKPALHIVLARDSGAVTVLVMPDKPIQAAQTFARGAWRGRLSPFYDGSLALIHTGDMPEVLKIEERVKSIVKPQSYRF